MWAWGKGPERQGPAFGVEGLLPYTEGPCASHMGLERPPRERMRSTVTERVLAVWVRRPLPLGTVGAPAGTAQAGAYPLK